VFPSTSFINYGYAEMGSFFNVMPYLLVIVTPALTMRLLAEEQQKNTLGLLFVLPIKSSNIVLAKFAATVFLLFIALLISGFFALCLYYIASPIGNIDVSGILGSYIGLLVLNTSLVAIGLWCSSMSANSIVAYLAALVLGYMFYDGFTQLAQIQVLPSFLRIIFDSLSFSAHFNAMGRGVLALIDLLFFTLTTILFLYFTWLNLQKAKA
jgi:ABC-2 type transport system permease protein